MPLQSESSCESQKKTSLHLSDWSRADLTQESQPSPLLSLLSAHAPLTHFSYARLHHPHKHWNPAAGWAPEDSLWALGGHFFPRFEFQPIPFFGFELLPVCSRIWGYGTCSERRDIMVCTYLYHHIEIEPLKLTVWIRVSYEGSNTHRNTQYTHISS